MYISRRPLGYVRIKRIARNICICYACFDSLQSAFLQSAADSFEAIEARHKVDLPGETSVCNKTGHHAS